MPIAQEEALKKVAKKYMWSGKLKKKKGESAKQAEDRFTYGTMRRQGWKPSRER